MTAADGRSRARLFALAFAVPTFFAAAPAHAQSGDAAAAETLFREGRARLDAKDYAHACPKLEASFRIDPATGTLLALALCYESSGKTASAWAAYTDAAARSKREGRADRERAARARAASLEPHLAKLRVALSPAAEQTAGIAVQRDGVALDAAAIGSAIPVDPGEHTITVSAPGKRAWSTTITVAADAKTVTVPPLEDAPAATASAPPVPMVASGAAPVAIAEPAAPSAAPIVASAPVNEAPATTTSGGRTAGFVIGGVGVAGVAVGTVFLLRAAALSSRAVQERDRYNANKADTKSNDDANADNDAAKSNQTIGAIVGGVGVAALVTGIVLVATSHASPRATAWIAPEIGPGRASIGVGGVF